jgi:hypothetical protein
VWSLEALSRSMADSQEAEQAIAQTRQVLQDTLPEVLRWLENPGLVEAARTPTS